jgi:germination protein M
VKRALLVLAVVLLLGGCGDSDERVTEDGATDTTTATLPVETDEVRVYFLRDGKVWPAWREVTGGVESAAVAELLLGPTEQEETELGFTTSIPDDVESPQITIGDGVARVERGAELPDEALAQVVYTLTQFPTVRSVDLAEGAYALTGFDRADFEDFTPAILVESPLPFEHATSPLRVTGTANTFEANFSYELTDTDGLIVAEDFVTATSGTGTRGTFAFTVPFEVKFDGVGSLIVFEPSAKDGSRTNLVEIPIRMKR